jgi:hypothetical protein
MHPSCLSSRQRCKARCGPIVSEAAESGSAEVTLRVLGRMTSLTSASVIVSRQEHCPYRQREPESGWGAGVIHAEADARIGSRPGGLRGASRRLTVGGRVGIVAGLGEFVAMGVGLALSALGQRPQVGPQLVMVPSNVAAWPLCRGRCAACDCCLC